MMASQEIQFGAYTSATREHDLDVRPRHPVNSHSTHNSESGGENERPLVVLDDPPTLRLREGPPNYEEVIVRPPGPATINRTVTRSR